MSAYEFDPDSVWDAYKALDKAVVRMNQVVEQPLRRVSLPEMPAAVRGQVASGIAEAIGQMSVARASIAQTANAMKQKTYDLVDDSKHVQVAKLGWGWKLGDIVLIKGSAFTGTDIIHKAINFDQYGWKGVGSSAVSFGSNFIPVGKIFGAVGRGGRHAIGALNGTNAARRAQVAAQLDRVSRAQGMRIRRPPPPATGGVGDAARGTGAVQNSTVRSDRVTAASGGLLDKGEDVARRFRFTLAPGKSHLYTGVGDAVPALVERFGATVINDTEAGIFLAERLLYERLPGPMADRIWGNASEAFIRQSSGPLNASVGSRPLLKPPGGATRETRVPVFVTRELPAIVSHTGIPSLTVTHLNVAGPPRLVSISRSEPGAVDRMVDHINTGNVVFRFVP